MTNTVETLQIDGGNWRKIRNLQYNKKTQWTLKTIWIALLWIAYETKRNTEVQKQTTKTTTHVLFSSNVRFLDFKEGSGDIWAHVGHLYSSG